MNTNNQTLSDISAFVKKDQVNAIQETAFNQIGSYHSNTVTMEVQLSPNQYAKLLKYGYAGKLHNVYYTVRSNSYAHFSADSKEEIDHLLEVIG
ncbi:hypothetical protein [Niallia sp. FSL W8-0635]|uniref:hypothetical protein n=1 Tax=Niallia sp. FSL W8-0635 TaxID=2975337 RepID=UPI0030F7DD9E